MGRRAREERREEREDKVAKQTKVKRKNNLKAVGILALIAIIVGYAGYEFMNMDSSAPGAPPGAGKLGDEHEHASLLVRIFGDKFDFDSTKLTKSKIVGSTLKIVMVLQFIDTHQE